MSLATPHGDKLKALILNGKLPVGDQERIKQAIQRYDEWVSAIRNITGNFNKIIEKSVALLNEYRKFIDLEVIFDSPDDFLYRQKGQLKLDNTVVEEFIPYLVFKIFPELIDSFYLGPQSCFSALYFTSTLRTAHGLPGMRIRVKDQDFAIAKKLYIKTSFDPSFNQGSETVDTHIGYISAECKTNLDKTMFQEASATAHDVKTGIPGAKYLLLCEWLDMTPITTTGTDIDEVLLLRKSKRLSSQISSNFSTRAGRQASRSAYERYLIAHPFAPDVFARFIEHIKAFVENRDPNEEDVLSKGYF